MNWQEVFGFIAGLFTTVGIVPQVWRLFKLKSSREISLTFTLVFLAGGLCWLVYGIALNLPPVIIWNAISVLLMALMLYAKIKYSKGTN